MKLLTLYTYSYEQALRASAAEAADAGRLSVQAEGCREGRFYMRCIYTLEALNNMAVLLEDIVVQENSVYRHSEKLQKLAQDLRETPIHEENWQRLRQYVKQNNVLHLEGYAAFRMADYRVKLDLMAYSLIKKMKLTEH